MRENLKRHWLLDPAITFLNHGSFGACPRRVLEFAARTREELETDPVEFMIQELPRRLGEVRAELAAFIGAAPADVVFTTNATSGVNAVLRSAELSPGDEILVTNQAYGPCRNALEYVAKERGASVVVARVPFPLESVEQITAAVLDAASARTRLALIDHVTSPTGLVFPIAELTAALQARGTRVLVDGAHAPGMVALDLRALGADYYAANLHKWCCAPKGAGFLWVNPKHQKEVYPLVISAGYSTPAGPNFQAMFDWPGTFDPAAWLAVGEALRAVGELGDGWSNVMQTNRALALRAQQLLCSALGVPQPAPLELVGALAAVPLPAPPGGFRTSGAGLHDALRAARIEVPIIEWPDGQHRIVRVSAQLYNTFEEYELLAAELRRQTL